MVHEAGDQRLNVLPCHSGEGPNLQRSRQSHLCPAGRQGGCARLVYGRARGTRHTRSGNSHVRLRSPVQKCDAGHTGRVAAFRAERQDSADQAAGL